METLMLLTYAALCIVVFKVFRIPFNKWTVPTAVLGGIALIGAVIFGMNYNFPIPTSVTGVSHRADCVAGTRPGAERTGEA